MPDQRRHHDVFLSYSTADKQQGQKLVERLTAQGLKVWFAPYEIHPGDQFPVEIEESLELSQTVVVVLSPASVDSFWVRLEWQARLVQMSKDKTRRLIPLLLKDCEMPLLLQSFQYVDFRGVKFTDPATLENKITELESYIREALPPPGVDDLPIPFAVLAMTRSDAEELLSPNFLNPEESRDLSELLATLNLQDPKDLFDRYGATPEDWRPFHDRSTTIRNIIEIVASWVSENQLGSANAVVRPQYYSQDFLSPDTEIRGRIWRHLEHIGCVLVVDSISVFHPTIRKLFVDSQLGTRKHIAIVGISPVNPYALVNQIIERAAAQYLQRIFERYKQDLDSNCAFHVGDDLTLIRWLSAVLPKAVETARERRATPAMKQLIRSKVSQPPDAEKLIYQLSE